MELPRTNMMVQSPYRKRLKVGDVFAILYPGNRYVFGRIMKLDSAFAGFESGCIKAHVYNCIATGPTPPPDLAQRQLLIPPQWINRLGFSRGYFPVVANLEPTVFDARDNACYRRSDGRYFTEDGKQVIKPTGMIGGYGLGNYLTMDDAISRAIGLPLVEDPKTQRTRR